MGVGISFEKRTAFARNCVGNGILQIQSDHGGTIPSKRYQFDARPRQILRILGSIQKGCCVSAGAQHHLVHEGDLCHTCSQCGCFPMHHVESNYVYNARYIRSFRHPPSMNALLAAKSLDPFLHFSSLYSVTTPIGFGKGVSILGNW